MAVDVRPVADIPQRTGIHRRCSHGAVTPKMACSGSKVGREQENDVDS